MALVKRTDGMYLIRQEPLQFGTLNQARSFFKIGQQNALDLAAGLRAAGVESYAANDSGRFDDPAYVEPAVTTDLSVRWPDKWQVEVEELGPSRYAVRFVDEFNQQRTVLGRNPQEAVDKLQMQSLVDTPTRNYLQSITPQPVAPVAPAASVVEGPRKLIRAGDRTITPEEFAEMDAQRAQAQVPKTPPAEIEYRRFYDNSPTNATRMRMKQDPGFSSWANKEGIFDVTAEVFDKYGNLKSQTWEGLLNVQ